MAKKPSNVDKARRMNRADAGVFNYIQNKRSKYGLPASSGRMQEKVFRQRLELARQKDAKKKKK